MSKKIIVKIAKDGQLTLEAEGFKGEACLEKTSQYIQGLGIETGNSKKPEFYEQTEITAGL